LTTQIKQLDSKIAEIKTLDAQRKALLDRIAVIERLQSTRPGIVHLFDEMVNALPKGLYLTQLQQTGNKIKIEGRQRTVSELPQTG